MREANTQIANTPYQVFKKIETKQLVMRFLRPWSYTCLKNLKLTCNALSKTMELQVFIKFETNL